MTLNRAEKRNAVDLEMFEALLQTGESLKRDTGVRAVVLHGSGEHFCAGIDISVFQGSGISAVGANKMAARDNSPANFFQSAAYIWREIPVPVIAALKGCVFGAGLQIAMGADIRYAASDVQMSIMEVKWGIIPDMAITTTLRHVVPTDKVRQLAYTGRIVAAAEAEAVGL
ncbi:MAG: enoyl-CoA hydratase/carnithine racemase, partial [Woeseiaceae bacterium]